jgi:tRNA-Thr(GGU) m(6)t(6)A37 methyltransferase TsaA
MNSISVAPIGVIRSTRTKAADDNWDQETATVELDESQFSPEVLLGVSDFSHVEILFHMNQVNPDAVEKSALHPRDNPAWPKVGIFAQRRKNRPNRIGCTICRVLKVDGLILHVEGLDAIDGTPVLDIKPWVVEFGPRGTVFQPNWTTELMREYWRG